MGEADTNPETQHWDQALQWFKDAREALAQDVGEISEEDARFLETRERGLQLSDALLSKVAGLQIRREDFFRKHGVDPVLEQFVAFKVGFPNKN